MHGGGGNPHNQLSHQQHHGAMGSAGQYGGANGYPQHGQHP